MDEMGPPASSEQRLFYTLFVRSSAMHVLAAEIQRGPCVDDTQSSKEPKGPTAAAAAAAAAAADAEDENGQTAAACAAT